MQIFNKDKNSSQTKEGIKLPGILKIYEDSDFSLQLKVRFNYYFTLVLILFIFIILLYTWYIQVFVSGHLNLLVLGAEIVLMFLFVGCLFLLIKGHFILAGNLLIIFPLIIIWFIIWTDQSNAISRLDTIIYTFAILSMLPLVINKNKWVIMLYVALNLVCLFVLIFYMPDQFLLSKAETIDYLADNAIASLFLGVVVYNIFSINKMSLEKAEADIKKRNEAERMLQKSEKKYREMTEFLPQIVFETDIKGNLTYVNKNGYLQFGYCEEDLIKGFHILSTLDPSDQERARKNIQNLFEGNYKEGNQYKAIRKDGSSFPVKIYTDVIKNQESQIVGLRGLIIDISEQVQMTNDLKNSRDQFYSLVNNIPGITYRCLMDNEWTMLFMSSEIDKLSGYPASDFIQNKVRTYESVIFHEDNLINMVIVQQAIQDNISFELNYRIKHKNGETRWAYEKGRAIRDQNGVVQYLDGFILDITDRKLAEKELKESEEKYRTLMENMNEVVMLVDNEDRVHYVNKKFTEKLGYTPDEIIGKIGYEILLDPMDQALIIEANKRREQNQVEQYEVTFISKNGERIDFLINGAPLCDANGVIWGSIGSMTDITERKQAEKKLTESEERYRKLIEAFPDIIMVSEHDGNIIFANNKLEEITGIKPEDYGNKNRQARIHPEDIGRINNEIEKLFSEDKNQTGIIENRFIDEWGNTRYFSGIISKINWQGKMVLQTISRDITDKKKIEKELENYQAHLELLVKERTEELESTNEELIAANEELYSQREELQLAISELNQAQNQLIESEKMASLGILAAGVAHEINNPLNFIQAGIVGIDEYITDNMKEHQSSLEPMIDGIKIGVDRVSKIVTSLNHFSRHNDSISEECNIHEIIDNCLIMLHNQMKFKIEVEKNYTFQEYKIFGNVGKLHQVFLNVLSNAQQSIPDKGVIKIHTDHYKGKLIIKISDSGSGIKSEHLSQIFNPFFTTKDPGKGTGLGLAITYKIIQEHKGTIEYHSKIGEGTTVVITLPAEKQT